MSARAPEQPWFLLDADPPAGAAPTEARIDRVIADGDALWERFAARRAKGRGSYNFVACDYRAVLEVLAPLRGRAVTFLEWGSGTGVVTLLAALLGFEACGIEIEAELVDAARYLARRHRVPARFVQGSFIPERYRWDVEHGDEGMRTVLDGAPAYAELDLELRDFDIVYAYPWPDEEPFFHDVMHQCGRRNALFLTYGAFEGAELFRGEPFEVVR